MVKPGAVDGFTLVEVLTSLVLVGVGALIFSAGSTWAARLLADAERAERAYELAALVLDSLAQTPAPTDGERAADGARVSWWAQPQPGGAVRLELRFLEPGRLAHLPPVVQVVGPPPPVLRIVPVTP